MDVFEINGAEIVIGPSPTKPGAVRIRIDLPFAVAQKLLKSTEPMIQKLPKFLIGAEVHRYYEKIAALIAKYTGPVQP